MKTQVFKNYEEFLNRKDKKINGVSEDWMKIYMSMYEKEYDYQKDNSTNVGCWDCIDCTNCIGCDTCSKCENCNNCELCDSCNNCENCNNCELCAFFLNLEDEYMKEGVYLKSETQKYLEGLFNLY